ncbi:Cytochrome P450 monooxygenase [Hyphodiscus hymeniophilus]|uniref:Cytochrome P450 monooxygenase n=1 Tax=Hyphodiscus hymeniophilus TaxID=353542 RepID=A0A9P7AUT5_9HELO|nr:Cytochrome P450 monooxygenase [Hyphodiscus hymeniophilus]
MLCPVHLIVVLIVCDIGRILSKVWIRIISSPLPDIPSASILAPVSRMLWALPLEFLGRLTLDLPILHEKHGPLLRIGPNEVSFYSLEIYKIVYSARSQFAKDPRVYCQFVQDNNPALFSITFVTLENREMRSRGLRTLIAALLTGV